MTVKIDGLGLPPARNIDTAQAASVARAGGDRMQPVAAAAAADSARFTGEATGLQSAINARIGQPPTMDMDRISAVRAALADGSYRVNPQEIANRLVSLERQMTG